MANVFLYGIFLCTIIGLFTGNSGMMFEAILDTPKSTLEIVTTLILSACLWNGILSVIKASGMLDSISGLTTPILRWIYGNDIKSDLQGYLSSNFIANLLGLGSLASISGLQAMHLMQKDNTSNVPSKQMLLLVVVNTTGLSIIPTTMMTIRHQLGSNNPVGFFPYNFIIGMVITILGIVITKRIIRHG